MGCHQTKLLQPKRTPRTPRPHRGLPPAKIYLRGTGELSCDGTYRRVYPNPKGQSRHIPRLLVLYVNKRGYAITNARTTDKTPKLNLRVWSIGHGQYPRTPWRGLFIATHRRFYRFDKHDEGVSITPPVVGWLATDSAHSARSCPLIAFDRNGDRDIRHKSFRITHGLEDPPEAPTSASFPARVSISPPPHLHAIREGREEADDDDGNTNTDSDIVGFELYDSGEDDVAVGSSAVDGAVSHISQFQTSRQFAEPSTNDEKVEQDNKQKLIIGQFESYRKSVQSMTESQVTQSVPSISSSSSSSSSLVKSELHNIYNQQQQVTSSDIKEETEEEKGFKSRTPTNEDEPIVTGASRALVEKEVEQVEFSRRKNVMFELEQEKWREQLEESNNQQRRRSFGGRTKNQPEQDITAGPHHQHQHRRRASLDSSSMSNGAMEQIYKSSTEHHHHHHKKKTRRSFKSPAHRAIPPTSPQIRSLSTSAPLLPPIATAAAATAATAMPTASTSNDARDDRIQRAERDLRARQQHVDSELSHAKSVAHKRLADARQRRKLATEHAQKLQAAAVVARRRAQRQSATTLVVDAAEKAVRIATRAQREAEKLLEREQEMEILIEKERCASQRKLSLAREKKRANIASQRPSTYYHQQPQQQPQQPSDDDTATRIQGFEQKLHTHEQAMEQRLETEKSATHSRLEVARKKRKEASERAAMLKLKAERARRKAQTMSGTTSDEHAANKAESVATRAAHEVKMLEQREHDLEIFVEHDREDVHKRLSVRLHQKQEKHKREKREQEEKAAMTRRSQVLAVASSVRTFADITTRTNEIIEHEKVVEKELQLRMMHEKSESHRKLMARKASALKRRRRSNDVHDAPGVPS